MKTINVELSENVLNKKASTQPINAIKEIVWNSCDADATQIAINLSRDVNSLGKETVTEVSVIDNGHGLSYDNLDVALSNFSESEKAYKHKSPSGRVYHGKLGEGRYTYFALGQQVIWKSVYKDGLKNKEFQITFDSTKKKQIKIGDIKISQEHCGMSLKIKNNFDYALDTDAIVSGILLEFAGYLLAHNDIQIKVDEKTIDVESQIKYQKDYSTKIKTDVESYDVVVKIITWKEKQSKKQYICGEGNVVYHEDPIKASENVCIYISSSYFDEMKKKGTIDALSYDEVAVKILKYADEKYSEFINEIRNKTDLELLTAIKEDEAYPAEFQGEITDTVVLEKQKMFDLVAVEVVKNTKTIKDTRVRKLNYQLIVEAINTNPSSLKKILDEVFNLSKEKQDEFAKILDHIPLNNVITTMQEVSDRILFLEVLYEIIYGESGKKMKERTEFQKILEKELWVFGDKYKYGATDESLRKILIKHINELGREEFVGREFDNEDLKNIPDICLFNKQKIGDKFENLIVEIKRPTKDIGEEQISQIKRYAFSIKDEPGFDKENTLWNFILIGRDFTKFTKNELEDKNNGLIYDTDNIRIYVKKWADLISEQQLRYEYFKEHSKIRISSEDISGDLEARWSKLTNAKNNE